MPDALHTLQEILNTFAKQFAFDPREEDFAFYNQWQLINSLYAYICIPKEKNHSDFPNTELSALSEKWGLKNQPQTYTLVDFIRHMRNAISHGHTEVTESLIFTFQDGDKSFSFHHIDLLEFCRALAYWCLEKDENLPGL